MQQWLLRHIPARGWLAVLLAGIVCLAGWELWLTLRLLDQDRDLELQRSHDRLGEIADLEVAQLARNLDDWDLRLHQLNSLPASSAQPARFPPNATLVVVSQGDVQVYPRKPLLFTPAPPAASAQLSADFDPVDELELREQQYDRAIAVLRPLALRPATRPEALLRKARIELKINRKEAALATYQSLAAETGFNPSGTPYALLAATARCRILEELGRKLEASAEAGALRNALLEGRWPLSREAFEYHWSELDGLGIPAGQPPKASTDFAAVVANLYERWRTNYSRGSASSGRESQPDGSLLVWDATPARLSALIAPPDWMNTTLKAPANSGDVHWKLLTSNATGSGGFDVTRPLAEVQLPGRLEFSSVQPISAAASSRRTLLLGGAALMLVVILSSGYVVHRAISREFQVAQLQSDFVAAVSHEFRSPLTTLRTITQLLANNRISDESRRQQSYVFLDRETGRLHRLVEDLLDFGRIESGRKQYRIEAHDAFELVQATLADFSEHAETHGFIVESDFSFTATIQVDEEAFKRALRNLLENAMKYSPECRTVWLSGAIDDRKVLISVRDQGMGIGPDEERAIFQKFVRGDAAKKAGIKGTGIGLAMVQQIAEAMGGEIRLQSEVGVGSTFTLVLPLTD